MDLLQAERSIPWTTMRIVSNKEVPWRDAKSTAWKQLKEEKSAHQVIIGICRLLNGNYSEFDAIFYLMSAKLDNCPVLKEVRDFAAHPLGLDAAKGPIRNCIDVSGVFQRQMIGKVDAEDWKIKLFKNEVQCIKPYWREYFKHSSGVPLDLYHVLRKSGEFFIPRDSQCVNWIWEFIERSQADNPITHGLNQESIQGEIATSIKQSLPGRIEIDSKSIAESILDAFSICILSIVSGCHYRFLGTGSSSLGLCFRREGLCVQAIMDFGDLVTCRPVLCTRISNDRILVNGDKDWTTPGESYSIHQPSGSESVLVATRVMSGKVGRQYGLVTSGAKQIGTECGADAS